MNDVKLVLANGEEIEVAGFSVPLAVVVNCKSNEDAVAVWQKLTSENLESVSITQNGETVASFQYVTLTNAQFVLNDDGNVTAHFYMRGENAAKTDDEYVLAAKILLGEEE